MTQGRARRPSSHAHPLFLTTRNGAEPDSAQRDLDRLSVVLLYLIGVAGLILVLTSIYLVMPPKGRIRPRHALVGGIAVGLLWEATRHILLWYFSTLSVVGVVYGSLATTIVGLLSFEIASIILLLGAQVIAEYERLQDGNTATPGELKTDAARTEVR